MEQQNAIVKSRMFDNFLHTLANQLANSNSVEETEEILSNAKMWLNINFVLRPSI
jgi:hypothetical protein